MWLVILNWLVGVLIDLTAKYTTGTSALPEIYAQARGQQVQGYSGKAKVPVL